MYGVPSREEVCQDLKNITRSKEIEQVILFLIEENEITDEQEMAYYLRRGGIGSYGVGSLRRA